MRIIAGSKKGHKLVAPATFGTRPASARVRESIFSILGVPPEKARVLDLFAGSGSVGLEALSRGAEFVVFVEQGHQAARAIQKNLSALQLERQAALYHTTVERALALLEQQGLPFDWIFVDPPYASSLASEVLQQLGHQSVLVSQDTVIVVESSGAKSHAVYAPAAVFGCLSRVDERKYGQTVVSFYQKDARI